MSDVPYVDAATLRRLVPTTAAVDALERTFRAGGVEVPQRSHVRAGPGELLVMPARGPEGVGVKLVTVNPENPPAGRALINGVYVLFSADTLEPVLTIDGAAVTALRTPAVSALATKHLAAPDARTLLVFGAGTQAQGHVEAMRAVRQIDSVVVVGRSRETVAALVSEVQAHGVEARAGAPEDVAEADIVCTCTTSASPLFDGLLLRRGAHVNAVGAYKPNARELDDAAMRRAAVYVEDRAAALTEAGDLLIPIESGALDETSIRDLRELLTAGPTEDADVTVFKSVGLASEDLAVATAAWDAFR
ncbi:MAG TPA: ornithine cyclodeaminase family protein [Actinomycetota bacterium]|nr:ornithine cyclodeaminase family protein [Actinomycetota bacterium]